MQQTAKGLRAIDCVPDVILSSPLPRARQTAEIVLEALGKRFPLILIDALAPAGNRQDVYREIRKRQDSQSLMLVGHQPSLGELAGEIAWGSPERYVELKKGGACALEVEAVTPSPRGTLVWLLTPSILRVVSGR